MTRLLIIGCGGFLGAIARYAISGWVHRLTGDGFPYGTLFVNLSGSFVIGVIMYLAIQRQMFTPDVRALVLIGLLGSFTTFSTVSYETFEYLKDGEYILTATNAVANLLLGIAACAVGWTVAKLLGV